MRFLYSSEKKTTGLHKLTDYLCWAAPFLLSPIPSNSSESKGRLHMIIAVFLTTCVDPISFEAETGQSQLVFFGNFSQLNQNHYFTIARTSDFDKIAIPVDGAQVTLWDDQGNSADYEASGEGKYTLRAETMNGVPGNSYHIEISLSTGASYRSDPQILPEPVELDNLYFGH